MVNRDLGFPNAVPGEDLSDAEIRMREGILHHDLITFIEQYWHLNAQYPTQLALDNYAESVNLTARQVAQLEAQIKYNLSERGIVKNYNTERLTELQIAAVLLMLNPSDTRSQDAKLAACGVTPTKWKGWLKQPAFLRFVNQQTEALFSENAHAAHMALLRKMEKGDSGALRLYYELTGQLKNDASTNNVQVIFAHMIEVIQRHVRDSEVILKIAEDFKLAMEKGGGQVPLGFLTNAARPKAIEGEVITPVAHVEDRVDHSRFVEEVDQRARENEPVAVTNARRTGEGDLFTI